MTTFLSKKNNALSKVATVGGIDNSTNPVTFAVTTGEGAKFPSSNFSITIDNEILLCTSRTGDNLTCTRAQESTTIAAHSQNADVENRITAAALVEHETAINLLEARTGAWTPTLACGTSGTITPTVTGEYLRIGNLVFATAYIVVDSVSSPVGTLTLGGLPFTVKNASANYSPFAIFGNNLNTTAVTALMGILNINAKTASIYTRFAAGVAASNAADVKATSYFTISIVYITTDALP